MYSNQIVVEYDVKTRRLHLTSPFHLADVMREYPARRFLPKVKKWEVMLNKANMAHFEQTHRKYDYVITQPAAEAMAEFKRAAAAPAPAPFPGHAYDFTASSTKYLPMTHQGKMLDKAWGLKACAWFAKMGTGKTYAAIHLAMARWAYDQIDGVMIICPSNLREVWRKELAKYATAPYDYKIHETKKFNNAEWIRETPRSCLRILAVSAEGLGVSEALYDSACGFMQGRILVICDESHRFKNPKALRTQRAIELGAAATYKVLLNGTPIALGIQDLWAQYELLDPNIIGSGTYQAFKSRYLTFGGYGGKQITGVQNIEELMRLILPYTCEVGKDVLDLPPKVYIERPIEITNEQRLLIKAAVKGPGSVPGAPYIKAENALEKMLRCRQIVDGWLPKAVLTTKIVDGEEVQVTTTELIPLSNNPKMDDLLDIIETNVVDSKFIIWSTFKHEIVAIHAALTAKYGPDSAEMYYGSIPKEQRPVIEDRYCNDPKMKFFIGNPVTAGLGLTLISGIDDIMLYYSGTSAYIDRSQSEDRAHRIGQEGTVRVVDIVATGTVDTIIQAAISAKMDVEEYIMTRLAAGVSIDDMLLGIESP